MKSYAGSINLTFINFFSYISHACVVLTGFFLPLSTAGLEISFITGAVSSLIANPTYKYYHYLRNNPVALSLVAFFCLFIVGLTYTVAPFSFAFSTLIKYSKFLLAFFLFPTLASTNTVKQVARAFLFSATVTLVFSYIKFFTGWDIVHRFGADSGIFRDHIFTGFLMGFMSYGYGLLALKNKKWRGWFALLFALAAFDTLFINTGRTGYIVFAALMILLTWQQLHWKGLIGFIIFTLLILLATSFFSNGLKNNILITKREVQAYNEGKTYTSAGLRLSFYKNSLHLIQKNPWIGTGTGSLNWVYSRLNKVSAINTSNLHNEYLNISVQLGIVGLALLLGLFYIHWHFSFQLTELKKKFAQAVVIAIAVGSCFNSWLMDVAQGIFYVFFTALLFANQGWYQDLKVC